MNSMMKSRLRVPVIVTLAVLLGVGLVAMATFVAGSGASMEINTQECS